MSAIIVIYELFIIYVFFNNVNSAPIFKLSPSLRTPNLNSQLHLNLSMTNRPSIQNVLKNFDVKALLESINKCQIKSLETVSNKNY